jgi:hypothetical protein
MINYLNITQTKIIISYFIFNQNIAACNHVDWIFKFSAVDATTNMLQEIMTVTVIFLLHYAFIAWIPNFMPH